MLFFIHVYSRRVDEWNRSPNHAVFKITKSVTVRFTPLLPPNYLNVVKTKGPDPFGLILSKNISSGLKKLVCIRPVWTRTSLLTLSGLGTDCLSQCRFRVIISPTALPVIVCNVRTRNYARRTHAQGPSQRHDQWRSYHEAN